MINRVCTRLRNCEVFRASWILGWGGGVYESGALVSSRQRSCEDTEVVCVTVLMGKFCHIWKYLDSSWHE